MKKIISALAIVLMVAVVAYAATVSVRPNGIAFPYWYGYSAGSKASYYLAAPTLSSNDTAVGLAATQTLTNKTLTSPTITSPTITSPTTTGSLGTRTTETVAATNAITAAECGTTFFLSHATEFASTLPAMSTVSAGCYFKFIVADAPESASYTIVTNGSENVLHGGINELEVDTNDDGPFQAAGDTITIADGVAVVGDYVEMISDGTYFYLTGQAQADGGITPSQAD